MGKFIFSALFFIATIFEVSASERFIPLELFLGSEIRSENDIKFVKVDNTFDRGRKRIVGPIDWKNSKTNKIVKVYKRIHIRKNKIKLFTPTNNNETVGRVYDSRYDAVIKNGAKFPLGKWSEGETRKYNSIYYYPDGRTKEYIKSITVEEINFTFRGNDNCLNFRWTKKKKNSGTVIDDNNYIFCPGKRLIKIIDR